MFCDLHFVARHTKMTRRMAQNHASITAETRYFMPVLAWSRREASLKRRREVENKRKPPDALQSLYSRRIPIHA
jgi:hypothetical protein